MLITVSFLACKKDPHESDTPDSTLPEIQQDPVVYVVGHVTVNNQMKAAYWKNGVLKTLVSKDTVSIASSIAVKGKDIYIGGTITINGEQKAVYWKNGSIHILDPGYVRDIYVDGVDVYVCGATKTTVSGTSDNLATYWKNGTAVSLKNSFAGSFTSTSSQAWSIISVMGNVHVAGEVSWTGRHVASYWKNGTATKLRVTSNISEVSRSYSIAANGPDVYIAGSINPGVSAKPGEPFGAVYWKNGVAIPLSENSPLAMARGIVVTDKDIYVVGKIERGYTPVYWKGKETIPFISKEIKDPRGISVYKDDVYVAGTAGSIFDNSAYPAYWKNGVIVILPTVGQGATEGILVVGP
ncbi:MAG: hypothetical protein ACO1N7_00260 [Sphingobacteriaceae bacterium]